MNAEVVVVEEKRRNAIALKIWLDSGIELDPDSLKRSLGNMEEATSVTKDDLKDFARYILSDAYGLDFQHGLSEERLGEIAYLLLLAKHQKKGLSLPPDAHKRALGALAEDIQVDIKELEEFSKDIFSAAYGKVLG